MRSNERLQRLLAIRQLGGSASASIACARPEAQHRILDDFRLFALTFAGAFLFTTIFIA